MISLTAIIKTGMKVKKKNQNIEIRVSIYCLPEFIQVFVDFGGFIASLIIPHMIPYNITGISIIKQPYSTNGSCHFVGL
jgi:hypothetical protein